MKPDCYHRRLSRLFALLRFIGFRCLVLALSAFSTAPSSCFAVDAGHSYKDAKTAYSQSNFVQACDILAPLIIGIEKRNAEAHYFYANSLFHCGRASDALAEYRLALALRPSAELARYCTTGMQACMRPSGKAGSDPTTKETSGYIGLAMTANTVKTVFDGSPAAVAGIKSGDKILSVDGKNCTALSTESITKLIVGQVGTQVKLDVYRSQMHAEFTLTRAVPVTAMHQTLGQQARSAEMDREQTRVFNDSRDRVYKTGKYASVANTSDAPSEGTRATQDSIKPTADEAALIKVFRKTGDTDGIYNDVVRALQHIPTDIKKELKEWGCVIMICPTVNEAAPESAKEKPRGYNTGGGQDNVGGMFSPSQKTVFVAERLQYLNSPPVPNRWTKSTTAHELGHAYDYCRKNLSASEPFSSTYEREKSRMSNTLKSKLEYFAQPGTAGAEELFAELFALNGGVPDYYSNDLKAAFPGCNKIVHDMF